MKLWSFFSRRKQPPASTDRDPGKIRIASPCSASWEEMKGNDWVRHCTECNLNVYNFSAMTWKEVERLIASHQGRLCARFYRRTDGTVLTQDCPRGLQAVVRRVSRWAGAALSAMAVVSSAEAQSQSRERANTLVQINSPEQTAAKTDQGSTKVVVLVTDVLGAVIQGATVRLMNQASRDLWTATTDQEGRAQLNILGPNSYKITVSAKGFDTYQEDMNLASLKGAELKLKLEVAAMMMGVIVEPKVAPVATEEVPFQSNLQPIPEARVPVARPKKRQQRAREHDPAGTAAPPAIPRTGQPHAVFQLKVTDPAGAMLPGAKVMLRDQNGNRQWSGVTDARGEFSMPYLPLGVYTLTIQSPGMASYENVIEAGDPGLVNLRVGLHPGALMGDVAINHVRSAPIDVESSVSMTFSPSDR